MNDIYFPNNPSVQEVIVGYVTKGKGIENDPVRRVLTFYKLDGTFIADYDTWLLDKLNEAK